MSLDSPLSLLQAREAVEDSPSAARLLGNSVELCRFRSVNLPQMHLSPVEPFRELPTLAVQSNEEEVGVFYLVPLRPQRGYHQATLAAIFAALHRVKRVCLVSWYSSWDLTVPLML